MAGDRRTYIRLHDGMPDHPKIVGLSDGAFRLWVEVLCWCSRHLTDGAMPDAALRKLGTAKARKEIVTAGLIVADSDGWKVHDYLQHQRSAAEVADIVTARTEAAKRGNHERWHVQRDQPDPECSYCIANSSEDDRKSDRKPDRKSDRKTRRKSSPETESDNNSPSESYIYPQTPSETGSQKRRINGFEPGSDKDPQFTAFWEAYPRRTAKGQARTAWRKAISRGADPDHVISAAQGYRNDPKRKPDYTAHPSTWLNGERYNDQPDPAPDPASRPWWEM